MENEANNQIENIQESAKQESAKKERREQRRMDREAESRKLRQANKAKKALIWLVVLFALGGGIFAAVKFAQIPSPNTNILIDPVSGNDWSRGNKEAAVVLIEYGDFQCPACRSYWPIVDQLYNEFSGQVLFIYRHFPLKGVHHSAVAAGIAAEAAGRQGKFWEMHDLLFEKQSEWANKKNSKDDFVSYASFLGLDLEKFKQDSENSELKGKVSEAYPNGLDLGLNSTPTFFINGQMITPSNLDEFRNIISNALGSQTE